MEHRFNFRWPPEIWRDANLDSDSLAQITAIGLPEGIGLRYAALPEPMAAGDTGEVYRVFAKHEPVEYWLGIDPARRVCAIGPGRRMTFVNSSMGQFARSMRAFRAAVGQIRSAQERTNFNDLRDAKQNLSQQLGHIDPIAMDDESNWWPEVLNDI